MEKEMLKGKVSIITGASYGMGQTMARSSRGPYRQRRGKLE